MFAKFSQLFTLAAVATSAFAAPLYPKELTGLTARTIHSFNSWGGHRSLDNFDNFYGSDNFDGSVHFSQVVKEEKHVVCHAQQVEIIQQRLVILQEMAKKIITEQVCEVETQVVVFQQFHASLGSFHHDLRRESGHQVGYDSSIVSHYGDILGSDGSVSSNDFGFSGKDIGQNSVIPSGSNWNDASSPSSVGDAYTAALNASSD
ncbi:hypothetical protein HGRIS_003888 [Hohenbuehelia grisea]|uniref:Uncharacterized protein n=1 Tax=Hohenbuehelia grisea TaxID=104357 RepID=A0ABR3JIF4_9AGAR